MSRITVAVVTCDFKNYSTQRVLERALELEVPPGVEKLVYLNIETYPENLVDLHGYEFLRDKQVICDAWACRSSWRRARQLDQDQMVRLPPIITARNMVRDFGMLSWSSHILYIDSDVLVPRDSIPVLLAENKNIISGKVPGRGKDANVHYLGSGKHTQQISPVLMSVDYATAGFVLVSCDVFRVIPWRWGGIANEPNAQHSEDPLFGYDAREAGFDWWYVRTDLVAEHLDNPERPLGEAAGWGDKTI